jgi:hypothetical protein
MSPLPIGLYFQPQGLRQEGDMDCGLPVFGALAGLTRETILHDVPHAASGLTVDEWKDYLRKKGLGVMQYGSDEGYPLPCAHLVRGLHWVYQARDGGFHDPSEVFQHTSPHLISLQEYYGGRVLTIAVVPTKGR